MNLLKGTYTYLYRSNTYLKHTSSVISSSAVHLRLENLALHSTNGTRFRISTLKTVGVFWGLHLVFQSWRACSTASEAQPCSGSGGLFWLESEIYKEYLVSINSAHTYMGVQPIGAEKIVEKIRYHKIF